jgi:hypothetical protein
MLSQYELEMHMLHRRQEMERRLARRRLIAGSRRASSGGADLRTRLYRVPAIVLAALRGA